MKRMSRIRPLVLLGTLGLAAAPTSVLAQALTISPAQGESASAQPPSEEPAPAAVAPVSPPVEPTAEQRDRFWLERGGLGNARKLTGMFYLTDFVVVRVMFSAVVVAAVMRVLVVVE